MSLTATTSRAKSLAKGPRVAAKLRLQKCRVQSQSTLSFSANGVSASSNEPALSMPLQSKLSCTPRKDINTRIVRSDADYFELQSHWNALLVASELASAPRHHSELPIPHATEMSHLVEAAARRSEFDKMLLLVHHAEGGLAKRDTTGIQFLTGRGMGQALSLSRRSAAFCTNETGLFPELVVLAPLATAIQTAMYAFPYHSPAYRTDIPWICHSDLVEKDLEMSESQYALLQASFPGVDFVLDSNEEEEPISATDAMVESKRDLLRKTDLFLDWIHNRQERVILVSSHSTWLQSFCGFALKYQPRGAGSKLFANGEMRAVGVDF